MTARENLLRLYRHERPDYIPADGPFDFVPTPGEMYRGTMTEGESGLDWFGVHWTLTKAVGRVAATPTPGYIRLNDIADWEKEQVIPSDEFIESFDWAGHCERFTARWDRENHVSTMFCSSGFFERLQHLLGFENALCALYEDPDSVHAFLDALLTYKKKVIAKMKQCAEPDVIIFLDDYGTSNNMFLSKEMWEEFFAPRLAEIIRYCKQELGLIFEMHSCGYITPLVERFVEMGIDCIQPLQAINDVKYVKERFGHKLTIHGGITASDLVGEAVSEDTARAGVETCCRLLASGNGFIPMLSECGEKSPMISAMFKECLAELGWQYG